MTRPTVQMLQHYGYALAALRSSLNNRGSIAAPETLCALYLIVILQGWLQQEDGNFSGHGEAIAMILSAMKQHQTAWGEFEHGIVKTLSFLVIMESLVNPRIQLDQHLRRMTDPEPLSAAKAHPQAISCLDNNSLVDISTYLRDPYTHYSSLVEAYDRVRVDRANFAALIASIPVVPSADGRILQPPSQQLCFVHLRYQTGYATLTLIAIRIAVVLARIPRSYSSLTSARDLQLSSDLRIYVNDLVTVAEQAVQYYPLGSSFMPLCLLAAYATQISVGDSLQQRGRIMRLFAQYRPGVDFEREWLRIKDIRDGPDVYGYTVLL
ncbi:transcription factor cys6 [Ophiostoma piceae UAMH 11346]|uniref:Transcription factor cys6 n=1 Tax=Ophiostoma piceae (strain UAMH 11346) TaxID=1262450 RepID=S3BVR5_OPHP1|nr:transcription factor cys6 [Ophiostoma piceae UAMH 11346]